MTARISEDRQNGRGHRPRLQLSSFLPWILCLTFLAWGWRVRNPFRELPSSGDALEVIWGIEWYHDALFVNHSSPLYTSFIFHPNGWHTATLAHTPALFLIAQPFRAIGGAAFAYNALAILSFLVAFFGCIRLFGMFNSSSTIVAVSAAVFTFVNFRWFRANGHHHILWASSFLPWFLWGLEKSRRASQASIRDAIFPGVMWGLMISFSLYSVFLGAVGFAIWGTQLFTKVRLKQALMTAAVALTIGAPTLVLYEIGKHADAMENFSAAELVSWSASLNSLPIPNVFHPIAAFRHLAETAYSGPKDESGVANFGIVTFVCAIAGAWLVLRKQRHHMRLVFLCAVGMVLALGMFIRWNGRVVTLSPLTPIDRVLWKAGHFLKPDVFDSAVTPPQFESGIPLPGYLLSIFIPFWEGGRVASRYALVGALGLITLAGIAVQRLPRKYQYLVLAAWLIEVLPRPTERVVLPITPHPAHQWLASQHLNAGEGILDVDENWLMMGSEIAFGTLYDRTPTAGGLGSFRPKHARILSNALRNGDPAAVLRQNRIRYLLLHVRGDGERELWKRISDSPSLRPVQCFEPGDTLLWIYPMCIAEVVKP